MRASGIEAMVVWLRRVAWEVVCPQGTARTGLDNGPHGHEGKKRFLSFRGAMP